jgi:hypothetical protein
MTRCTTGATGEGVTPQGRIGSISGYVANEMLDVLIAWGSMTKENKKSRPMYHKYLEVRQYFEFLILRKRNWKAPYKHISKKKL